MRAWRTGWNSRVWRGMEGQVHSAASSSLQGDAQLTLAYDMMITAANKDDRALQQPLMAGPRSQEQVQRAKVEGSSFRVPGFSGRSTSSLAIT